MTVKRTKHSESRIHAQVDLIELRKNLCLEWKETEAKVEKAVAEQFLQQLVRQVERLHLGGSAICRACCARTMQEEHSIFRFFQRSGKLSWCSELRDAGTRGKMRTYLYSSVCRLREMDTAYGPMINERALDKVCCA